MSPPPDPPPPPPAAPQPPPPPQPPAPPPMLPQPGYQQPPHPPQPPQYQQQPPHYQQMPQQQYQYQQHPQYQQYQQPPVGQYQQYQQPPQPPGMQVQVQGRQYQQHQQPPQGVQPGYVAPAPGPMQPGPGPPKGQWTTGLCDCFEDLPSCAITFFLPCVSHGMVYGRADGGRPWFVQCCLFIVAAECCYAHLWLLGTMRRSKVRQKYGLPEDPCADCCVGCCCTPCAICQEWRELDRRGVPSAGGPF